jgi:hypothetical protein
LGYEKERLMRDVRAFGGLLVVLGCASAPSPRPPGSAVEFGEVLPSGFESLGRVHAECRVVARAGRLEGVPVASFVCRRSELERGLVEQANARGGSLLAQERCRKSGALLACTALAARPDKGALAASPASAPDDDGLSATVASHVFIDLERHGARFERGARAASAVTEFVSLPVGHVELGVMRARCDERACDDGQARAGLRLAAGGLGVSDLVGVRCFALDGERSCVGTLGVSERDPDTDPSAR